MADIDFVVLLVMVVVYCGQKLQLLEYQTDVRRCRFDKPGSLLRPYIADTSALLMLELGLMPVVTTMAQVGQGGRLHEKQPSSNSPMLASLGRPAAISSSVDLPLQAATT